ncbi:MAG TPA: RNA pseudouridine synthase [Pseudonocardia sp.]|nr:RNA pseudouridine synthase [Pseudonocardia sp.]
MSETGTGPDFAEPPAAAGWTWAAVRRSRVVLEDAEVLVLDKPPGISVIGERHDDDLVDLAARAGERLFPVHRIDKVTSGVVLLAKTPAAHGPLTRRFADRSATKGYLAVVEGTGLPAHFTVDLPLGVGRKNRVRVAAPREAIAYDEAGRTWRVDDADVIPGKKHYPSVTHVHRVWEAGGRTLVVARPVTGRRHQIRVHLAWTGTAIVGDPLFRPASGDAHGRAYLHAWRLRLTAAGRASDTAAGRASETTAGRDIDVTATPDPQFLDPLGARTGGAPVPTVLAAAEEIWALAGHPGATLTEAGRSGAAGRTGEPSTPR